MSNPPHIFNIDDNNITSAYYYTNADSQYILVYLRCIVGTLISTKEDGIDLTAHVDCFRFRYCSMYALSTENRSRNFSDWNTDDFLDRMRVRIGVHNLVKDDADYLNRDVAWVVVNPGYSRSRRRYNATHIFGNVKMKE